MDDPCRNPACGFHAECSLRPRETSRQIREFREWVGLPPANPVPPFDLTVKLENPGWIGELEIGGSLASLTRRLEQVEAGMNNLAGLLVVFDCFGGAGDSEEVLERFVLTTGQRMPVVSYVECALSAAINASLAADLVLGGPRALCGGFGEAYPICDGETPQVIVSSQSPRKLEGGQPSWPPTRLVTSEAYRQRIQDLADRDCEKWIQIVAQYCRTTPDRIRPFLDGRALTAEEAVEAGLLDDVCTREQAYMRLLRLAKTKEKKGEKNGISNFF